MTGSTKPPKLITMRPNKDDWDILQWLSKRLGIKHSEVIRLALRRLWQSEKEKK
jgi:hypothetical protein